MENTEDSILIVSGHDLTTKDVYEVAAGKKKVALSDDARRKMQESFELVKMIAASGRASYGISTGFGEMSKVYISEENNAELQHN